ncbi:sugar nucleotide-binding protein [Sporolactobacillus sp. CPB3-1]|uniref:dTDP-4-dehydrorhamnose reductase n=1 Tax=Sporolactobacillus mangiferae TaxID=2940498 RepID=A0ABT0M6T4_9BACL|nr:sugar nucleotide-binding protein [Sporolactobacillus mangiferae]MCL1630570.1 sugar nucleotide-binding protein [Sporolactobacillus mangiferae]
MKLLIFGGEGMAGHVIVSYFQELSNVSLYYTTRTIDDRHSIYFHLPDSVKAEEIIEMIRPDIVINCIEIAGEEAEKNPLLALQINSLFPYQLAKLTERQGGRLIHLSTDCVFSGARGVYSETDDPDSHSVYATSKHLGEVTRGPHLTIRASVIGPELRAGSARLFSRFMECTDEISGAEYCMWNGVTTLELAKAIKAFIDNKVTGLYHLSSPHQISEKNLLELMQRVFLKNEITIIPEFEKHFERFIKNSRTDADYQAHPYDLMLMELKQWMNVHTI